MEGFERPRIKERPTDEPRVEIPRENKIETAAKSIAEEFKKRFAEMSVGQSFETERSF